MVIVAVVETAEATEEIEAVEAVEAVEALEAVEASKVGGAKVSGRMEEGAKSLLLLLLVFAKPVRSEGVEGAEEALFIE